MFIEVSVVLAWVESSVFLFDKEERSGLGGVGGTDFSSMKIFVKKCFGGKAFVRGERIEFSYFRSEGVGEVDFVVVRSRGRDMVSCFLGKYQGELGVFGGKDSFRFCSLCGSGKFSGGSESGDYRRPHRDKVGTTSYDSVEGSVFTGSVNVSGFFLPLVVFEEVRVHDGIYIYMARGTSGGFEKGVVSFVVDFVGGKEEFRFVDGFVKGEGLGCPVDGGVGGS